jgi:serine/threonine protein phosphatase PrpC
LIERTQLEEGFEPRFISSGRTDVGKLRPTNQDAFVRMDEVGAWVVADGMGGYRDGDVASRMVCEAFDGLAASASIDDLVQAVRDRVGQVNRQLFKAATRLVNPIVSGSTVAVLLAHGRTCAVVWAGDSRIYRLRAGEMTQLTTDHTWAAELNLQTPNEEADHAITRAVGGEGTLSLDVRCDHIQVRDRYLLCSDGLTHELGDARIAELLARGDAGDSANALIDATLRTSARDNVTVVVVDAT